MFDSARIVPSESLWLDRTADRLGLLSIAPQQAHTEEKGFKQALSRSGKYSSITSGGVCATHQYEACTRSAARHPRWFRRVGISCSRTRNQRQLDGQRY